MYPRPHNRWMVWAARKVVYWFWVQRTCRGSLILVSDLQKCVSNVLFMAFVVVLVARSYETSF